MISLQRNLLMNLRHIRSLTTSPIKLSKKNDGDDREGKSQEEATNKLNELLNKMIQEDDGKPKTSIKLVQAVKRKHEKREKEKPLGKQLEEAAKDVATSIGGDIEKTESELLQILLRRSESDTNVLKDVLANIKVDKSKSPESRAQQVKTSLRSSSIDGVAAYENINKDMKRPRKKTEPSAYVDILGAEPSTYFKDLKPQSPSCELQTWTSCVERDMRLATTHPPTNIYEQMIQWTNKGMMWHFPIDNFQGLEEEKKVSFEDHVFLEQHLEGWCPERGPIRHFMELICVGLAKNYWLTVEEKKRHIMWYRDYFADKKALIKELGAGTIEIENDPNKNLFESVIHRPMT